LIVIFEDAFIVFQLEGDGEFQAVALKLHDAPHFSARISTGNI
jgi:hypothetical protein